VLNKLTNPGWTDPTTHRTYSPDDPKNPIGEHWIGLEGLEGEAVGKTGYGVHGTIEPQSIGRNESLGCIRLLNEDVARVYELLTPGRSTVIVR
jgi:lipoprotein-anchoring transpeptidase ErfK/SrfK